MFGVEPYAAVRWVCLKKRVKEGAVYSKVQERNISLHMFKSFNLTLKSDSNLQSIFAQMIAFYVVVCISLFP